MGDTAEDVRGSEKRADGASAPSALAAAADGRLAALGRLGAAATLRDLLVVSGEQSFDL